VALALLTLLAWGYLAMQGLHHDMDMAASMAMPASQGWGIGMLAMSALMWCVMMVAMMLPAASPMILTHSKVHRQRTAAGRVAVPTWLFVVGYLAVWTGFAILAALAQWALHEAALLSSAMGRVGPSIGGGLLLAAGIFQWSSLKQACLSKCRTPLSFLLTEWRDGRWGAFVMGVSHGIYCTGCCWVLMLLMFVGGVMSLAWMAALAIYVLAEKVLPGGWLVSRAVGVLLIGAGVAVTAVSTMS
jgi:predicted metal-binding membrane protein